MKIISISKKSFEKLHELELPPEVFNNEAEIYDFNYRGEEKVLKVLNILNGKTFANKLYTLEMLDNRALQVKSIDIVCIQDDNKIAYNRSYL